MSMDGKAVWGVGVPKSSCDKGPASGQWKELWPYLTMLGSSSELEN